MKSIVFISIVISALCFSCKEAQADRSIVVLHDVTHGDTTQVLDLVKVVDISEQYTYSETRFTYRRITDVDFNRTMTFSIASVSEWSSNQYEREQEIQSFMDSVSHIDTRVGEERSHSSIWTPLWNSLTEESRRNGSEVTIYLVSDCMERDFIDLYDKGTRRVLFSNPEMIRGEFQKRVPENVSVKGIRLVICHQPASNAENELFRVIQNEIYKPILSEYGVSVETRSHL